MFIPDTNVLIRAFSGIEPYASWLVIKVRRKEISLSTIVLAEFLSGANKSDEISATKLSDIVDVLPIDKQAAQIGGKYRREYNKKSKKVWLIDCLIAATCKVYGATLVTFDKKDYPMKDIKIINL